EFQDELSKEVGLLSTMFNSSISAMRAEVGELIRTNLNVVLLLFPIPSKKQLIKSLHEKLYKYQA
ncbi:MAG TPA: hypothetical protein VNX68_11775, partial [Nitrosopumilaceae archaeon]|nr:hypothetical protein [Nitrosopumilaceae archaeon]